jgi:hypothetical protein
VENNGEHCSWHWKKKIIFLCTLKLHLDEEKHKLVHTINRSLDRESNPRPLAYGNTASIKGTTTSLDRESNPRPLAYGNTASIKGTTTLTTRRALRGTTYDPGHWTFYFVEGDLA